MVIRIFIWLVRYLLQLPIKITILVCRWIKLWTCFVIIWAKRQVKIQFILNLSLNFYSSLDLYLNGSGPSVENNSLYRIGTSYWVENLQLSFHLPTKSIDEFKWYTKNLCLNNKFQVLTSIWFGIYW